MNEKIKGTKEPAWYMQVMLASTVLMAVVMTWEFLKSKKREAATRQN